jgi:hypothetical protein
MDTIHASSLCYNKLSQQTKCASCEKLINLAAAGLEPHQREVVCCKVYNSLLICGQETETHELADSYPFVHTPQFHWRAVYEELDFDLAICSLAAHRGRGV